MWRTTLLAALLVTAPARIAEAEGEAPRVLLLAPEDESAGLEVLRDALEAQLSEYDVAVEIVAVQRFPREFVAQVEAAREASRRAFSVVWLTRAERELFIFVADRRSEKIIVEALPGPAQSWESTCDALATVARSALRPWLAAGAGAPEAGRASPQAPRAEPVAPAAPAPPARESPPAAAPGKAQRPDLRAVVSAGYAPIALDLGGGRFAHGAELGIGIQIRRRLEVAASVLALGPVGLDVRGAELRYALVPVRLSVAGALAAGRFDLGCRLGAVAAFSRVEGIPPAEAAEDTGVAAIGFSPSLFARLRVAPWLAVHLEVGADLFGRDREYEWDGEVVFRTRRVQPRLAVGLALFAPTGPG